MAVTLSAIAAAPAAAVSAATPAGLQRSGTTQDLTAVSFADADHGHVVGHGGTILATADGGRHWASDRTCTAAPACSRDLTGVSFPDRDHGWAVGRQGTLLATRDAGRTWFPQVACAAQPPCPAAGEVTDDLAGVDFVDPNHGWIVGRHGVILGTDTGGQTWKRESLCPYHCAFNPADIDLSAVSFADLTTGWAAGPRGGILVTSDGGQTWLGNNATVTVGSGASSHAEPAADLTGVALTIGFPNHGSESAKTAIAHAVGRHGTVIATDTIEAGWYLEQGPANLSAQPSGTVADLRGVDFSDHLNGHAVGDAGTLLATRDGGQTWTAIRSGTTMNLQAVDFPDANTGYAVGDGGTIVAVKEAPPTGLTVGEVTPTKGPTSGELPVTIVGKGFSRVTDVNFGRSFTSFTVESDSRIDAIIPPGFAQPVHVTVSTPEGVSTAGNSDVFTYLPPSGGAWRATAPCPAGCGGPGVLLHDGRVLVEGASWELKPTASAYLYDARSGTWSSTEPMHWPRHDHTASLLTNGKVLVTGGDTVSSEILASAEIYDPASGTWTVTASMHHQRNDHTATVLNDGTVLVAGGGSALVAEIYDPAQATWTETSEMLRVHLRHTATLLPDGRVLVVAGSSSGGADTAAELYDPATHQWHATGSLAIKREDFTATLLASGRVLVVGGFYATMFRPNTTVPYAELYDPGTGLWQPTGPLALARHGHTASLLPDGKVLVAGGFLDNGPYCRPCGDMPYPEIFDPDNGRWSIGSSMLTARTHHSATVLGDGSVLISGGVVLARNDDLDGGVRTEEVFVSPADEAGTPGESTTVRNVLWTIPVVLLLAGALVFLLSRRSHRVRNPLQSPAPSGNPRSDQPPGG